MPIALRVGNVLDDDAEALIINADPVSAKTIGKVGRALAERIGEAEWDYLLEQVKFPFPTGRAQLAEIDADEVKFKRVIVAGAFDHFAEGAQHAAILREALRTAFELARKHGLKRIAMAFSTAGWRLTAEQAVRVLAEAAQALGPLTLTVTVPDEAMRTQLDEELAKLRARLS